MNTLNELTFLKKKVASLQSLLKDSSKTSFTLFMNKLNTKQKKFDTIKKSLEI